LLTVVPQPSTRLYIEQEIPKKYSYRLLTLYGGTKWARSPSAPVGAKTQRTTIDEENAGDVVGDIIVHVVVVVVLLRVQQPPPAPPPQQSAAMATTTTTTATTTTSRWWQRLALYGKVRRKQQSVRATTTTTASIRGKQQHSQDWW
jgi:hypothetical protein